MIGIHLDAGKFMSPFSEKYERILQYNGLPFIRMDVNDPFFFEQLSGVDHFIFRWGHAHSEVQKARSILPVVEGRLKIKTFPDQNTCWSFDDKIRQSYLMRKSGFPFLENWVFWDSDHARDWARNASYPVVFKLKAGAGSSNVLLVRSERECLKYIDRMFRGGLAPGINPDRSMLRTKLASAYHRGKDMLFHREERRAYWQIQKQYAYFQRYLPGNDYDTRITVIGDRAFSFRRLIRENDFRASGSGKIEYDFQQVDSRCIEIAFAVSREFGFQSMSYDFIRDAEGNPWICEFSYTFQDRAVYRCGGYRTSELVWIPGGFWPQYCQLVDFLGQPSLKQPEMT